MIPTNLPLPHSSSTHRMSQSEQNDLAEQWYAMMIKEDIDSNTIHSTLSTLTRSNSFVSSREEQQEQRDPIYQYRDAEGERFTSVVSNRKDQQEQRDPRYQYQDLDGKRLLDKNMQFRDHPNEYQNKKSSPQYQQHQRFQNDDTKKKSNHKTDFLDGIIKSLSELSNNESKSRQAELRSILQEKNNGWSIHDTQRRMQESARERSQSQGRSERRWQSRNTEPSNIYQQSDGEYEERKRLSSTDYFESRSLPSMHHNVKKRSVVRDQNEVRHDEGHDHESRKRELMYRNAGEGSVVRGRDEVNRDGGHDHERELMHRNAGEGSVIRSQNEVRHDEGHDHGSRKRELMHRNAGKGSVVRGRDEVHRDGGHYHERELMHRNAGEGSVIRSRNEVRHDGGHNHESGKKELMHRNAGAGSVIRGRNEVRQDERHDHDLGERVSHPPASTHERSPLVKSRSMSQRSAKSVPTRDAIYSSLNSGSRSQGSAKTFPTGEGSVIRGRNEVRQDEGHDHDLGKRESQPPASTYERSPSVKSRSMSQRSAKTAPTRDAIYSSLNSGSRSQGSAKTIPTGDPSSASCRTPLSWNVDQSLRNINRSLFDAPISPESAISTEKNRKQPLPEPQLSLDTPNFTENTHSIIAESISSSGSSRGSDRYSNRSEPPQNRKMISRQQRSTSLAFSSSKDAGKILQYFSPNSCGPINGENPLDSVANFFDTPIRSRTPRKGRRITTKTDVYGEKYPSRPRSEPSKRTRRKSENYRLISDPVEEGEYKLPKTKAQKKHEQEILRGSDHFEEGDQKFPKTKAQKKHEQEILRGVHTDSRDVKGPDIVEEKLISHENQRSAMKYGSSRNQNSIRKQKVRKEDNRSNDSPIHGLEHRDSANTMPSFQNHIDTRQESANSGSKAIASSQFATNLGSIAASVMRRQVSLSTGGNQGVDQTLMHQLTRCNDAGHESPPKFSKPETNEGSFSPSALSMFKKIQSQLTGQKKIDSTGFPVDNLDENKNSEEEQRIQEKLVQEKLDAVRVRSIRNAEIFHQMQNGEQMRILKDDEVTQLQVAEENADQMPSINKSSEREECVDQLIDKNTDRVKDIAATPETSITNTTGKNHSSVVPAQKGIHMNELSHYMYVAYSQFGQDATKVLKLCGHHTIPIPDRRKGEILVRIHASTVSAVDCAIRRGEWTNISMDPYIIPGCALVGKAMGREKKKPRSSMACIEPGDNVLSLSTSGANARYICLPKNILIKIPPKLNPERVVCLAETYLTAFQALHLGHRGGMRYRDNSLRGQSILIMDGYSPLGKAIIELSRVAGASICYGLVNNNSKNSKSGGSGSSSSPDVHQQYKSLEEWGAIPLSNDPQEWLTLIGRQIDILVTAYDPNQASSHIGAEHWMALKKEGQVHVVCSRPGMTEREQRNLILGSESSKNTNDMKAFRLPSCRPGGREKMADRALYYNLFDSWQGDRASRATARKDLEHLMKLLEVDLVQPKIFERFPLSKVGKAQRSLDHHKVRLGEGHLICTPWVREKAKEPRKSNPKEKPKDTRTFHV